MSAARGEVIFSDVVGVLGAAGGLGVEELGVGIGPVRVEGRTVAGEGGGIAVAANIKVDLTKPTTSLEGQQGFTLECAPDEAKARLAQVAEAGFDHCVLVVNDASEENLTAVRALM